MTKHSGAWSHPPAISQPDDYGSRGSLWDTLDIVKDRIEAEELSATASAPPEDTVGSQSARSDSPEEDARPAWDAKHVVNRARYIYWIFAAALGGFISVGVYLINRLLVARKTA